MGAFCSILDSSGDLNLWKISTLEKAMIAVTPATPDPLGSRNTRCRVCFVLCCSFANATICIKSIQSLALGQRNVFQYDVLSIQQELDFAAFYFYPNEKVHGHTRQKLTFQTFTWNWETIAFLSRGAGGGFRMFFSEKKYFEILRVYSCCHRCDS